MLPPGCYVGAYSPRPGDNFCFDPTSPAALDPNPPPVVYYEYVRRPCVSLSFFPDGKAVDLVKSSGSSQRMRQCADPKTQAAAAACCRNSDTIDHFTIACEYVSENVDYETAVSRCQQYSATNLFSPPPPSPMPPASGDSDAPPTAPPPPFPPTQKLLCNTGSGTSTRQWNVGTPYPDGRPGYYASGAGGGCAIRTTYQFMWSEDDCAQKVQIGSDGMVNIVTEGPNTQMNSAKLPLMDLGSGNVFRTRWKQGAYPVK